MTSPQKRDDAACSDPHCSYRAEISRRYTDTHTLVVLCAEEALDERDRAPRTDALYSFLDRFFEGEIPTRLLVRWPVEDGS